MSTVENVIVIGSGPSGWTAAIYMARAKLQPLVIAGEQSGGQLMLTTEIENFPGFPKGIYGPELMVQMRSQAERFGTRTVDQNVTKVDLSKRPFTVWVGEKEYFAKSLLISTGASSIMTGVKGEQELIGRGVSTCAVCDAAFFRDKTTFVIGGGDSAMEDTLALTKFAKSVTLVHRRDSFRASKIMQDRVLESPKVEVLWNSQLKEIKGTQKVESIMLENLVSHSVTQMPAEGVFIAIGHTPATGIFKDQIQLNEKGYIVTNFVLEKNSLELAKKNLQHDLVQYITLTSIDGVFAAGDVVDFKYRQAITAAGYGTMAALDIEHWLENNS